MKARWAWLLVFSLFTSSLGWSLVSGISGANAQEPTVTPTATPTPTDYWTSIWDTPTPLPTRRYECCEGTPEGWGLCTPAAVWMMNCAHCIPVPTSALLPPYTPFPTNTPWPVVTVTPTPSGTLTATPDVTATPEPTRAPGLDLQFDPATAFFGADPEGGYSMCEVLSPRVGHCHWRKLADDWPAGGPFPLGLKSDTVDLADYRFDQVVLHVYPAQDGLPLADWFAPPDCDQPLANRKKPGLRGCQWSASCGYETPSATGYGSYYELVYFGGIGDGGCGHAGGCKGVTEFRFVGEPRACRTGAWMDYDWTMVIYSIDGTVVSPSLPTATPTPTVTPTPTITPTVTPTPVSDTYCCTVECEDPGGGNNWGMLPNIQIGIGDCVTIDPYDLSAIGLGQFPGVEFCAVPVRFGDVNIIGVTLSIDVLATVAAALVALRLVWRS